MEQALDIGAEWLDSDSAREWLATYPKPALDSPEERRQLYQAVLDEEQQIAMYLDKVRELSFLRRKKLVALSPI